MISRYASSYIRALKATALAAAVALLVTPGPAAAQISALKSHDTAQAIDITADRLEVREKESIAVFTGAVVAVQGDLQISADSVTVYYEKPAGGGDPTITRLDMAGNAKLVSPSEEVESEWAVYDVAAHLLTLGGSVVLLRGDSVLRGDRLELDLESGITKFEGAPVVGADAEVGVEAGAGERVPPLRVRGRFSVPDQGPKQGDGDSEDKSEKEEQDN